jgi:hypothetical protein
VKAFIAGVAVIIILLLIITFWQDHLNYRLQAEFLKHCADEASASALLYYDNFYNDDTENPIKIGKNFGQVVFDELEGIKAIEYILKNWLKLYKDEINYTAYFFNEIVDESLGEIFSCSVYKNGRRIDEECFITTNRTYMYKDSNLKYEKLITTANVIVTINAGKARFRQVFISEPILIRSSGYDYEY